MISSLRLSRRAALRLAALAGLIAVPMIAFLVLASYDWNKVKPWLNASASEAIGRPFAINGDLSISWEKQTSGKTGLYEGWRSLVPWPHLVAQDIVIGNSPAFTASAPKSLAGKTASVRQFAFSLNPFALLDKKISIPILRFDGPVVNLVRAANGSNNWTFAKASNPSVWQLEIQHVVLSKGRVHLMDAANHADIKAEIDTFAPAPGPDYGVAWRLHGRFNGEAVKGSGKSGAVLSLQRQTRPYPVQAALQIGETKISVEGTLTKPTDLAAIDMRLKLSGVSMAKLYAVSGILLPETPPFLTEGRLIGKLDPRGAQWTYEKFSGKVGSSTIRGSLVYQARQPRALLSGTVHSNLLQFSDLASLIGADSNQSKVKRGAFTAQPASKVLPVEPFKTGRWTSIDADILFDAKKIVHKKALPIKKMSTHLRLQDGVLSLMPLTFQLAGGTLSSEITLDGSDREGKNAIRAEIKARARNLNLHKLFPHYPMLQASAGKIDGGARLSAVGDSVGSLLRTANGEVKLLVGRGSVSKRLLETMGLNIGNVILTHVTGDSQVDLNCIAAEFGVQNGMMQTRNFVVDTDDAVLDIIGTIDVTRERLDLTLKPTSTGMRIFSLRAPIYVGGTFQHPETSVDKGVVALKIGGAIALAALAPAAAILPLINIRPPEESQCATLLAAARIKPVAPPPGKTYRIKDKARAH